MKTSEFQFQAHVVDKVLNASTVTLAEAKGSEHGRRISTIAVVEEAKY